MLGTIGTFGTWRRNGKDFPLLARSPNFNHETHLYGPFSCPVGTGNSPPKSLLPTLSCAQRLFPCALPTLHLFRKLVGIPNHVVLFLPRIGVYTIEQAVLITPEVIAGLRAAAVLLADAHGEKRSVVFPGGGFTDPLLGEGRPQRRNQHPPPDAPGKGFEMSVVEQTVCRPFCYPTPYLLHYSQSYQKQFAEDLDGWCRRMNGVDYDLAAHFTVIRQAGICLCGKPIAAVFGQVPRENYLDSICRDVQDAPMQILDQPFYLTLNLCRVLAACRQGLVLSKCEGVCWAMQEDSLAEFFPMLKQAQLCYQSAEEFIWESEPLKRFAKIALNQIDSALLKTQQDEKRRICQMEQNKAEKWCKIEIYNEYLKKIPSLLVQIHAVEKMYEKAKLEQQMLTTQPENDSRRQYQARLDSTERQCVCRLQEMQEELRLVQGLKAQLEEELGEQLGCK